MTEQLMVSSGDILVLVGTTKGAFLFRTDPEHERTEVTGPHFPGEAIYSLAYDDRAGRRRVLAGTESSHWGSVVRHTDDLGATWTDPAEGNVRFPADAGAALTRVWQLAPADDEHPEVVYAGVEPAALFRSADGGKSWRTRHQGVRAQFLPDQHPEFGQCVHKVAPAAGRPQRMYLQNHWGLYRTDDAGAQWVDIANGVPSDFGFPIVAHPSDPDTAWCIPLTSDGFRCTAEGRARVFRTRDAGDSWEPLTGGLPQEWAFLTVLRDGFGNDGGDPVGLYFGTRTGELFGSADEGDSWN